MQKEELLQEIFKTERKKENFKRHSLNLIRRWEREWDWKTTWREIKKRRYQKWRQRRFRERKTEGDLDKKTSQRESMTNEWISFHKNRQILFQFWISETNFWNYLRELVTLTTSWRYNKNNKIHFWPYFIKWKRILQSKMQGQLVAE